MTDIPNLAAGPSVALSTIAVDVTVFLPVPPVRAFTSFLNDVDHWWTYRVRDRARCILEPEIGGRWMQTWDNGGSLFGIITVIDPPQMIRVQGPLAMTGAAMNVVDFIFEEAPDGTHLIVQHRGFGDIEEGSAEMYESGWHELLGESFHAWLSRG